MLTAAAFAAAIPEIMDRAVHSAEWAPEVLLYTLLDTDAAIREQQLLLVAERMGVESEGRVRALLDAAGPVQAEARLPLLELAFPTLKQRTPEYLMQLLDTVKSLIEADGRTEVFEFLLARSLTQHLWAAENPHRVRMAGTATLDSVVDSAVGVLGVLARRGNPDAEAASAAFSAGLTALSLPESTPLPEPGDWVATMDRALPQLDRLKPAGKERLVRAMATVVMHDGTIAAKELELLRVVCDLIHVPLPLLTDSRRISPRS
jgi:hypothetical protein